jgi:type III secretion protein U
MSDEKTEAPTRHRRKKAREDGQTARSTDLVQAVGLGAVLGAVALSVDLTCGAVRTLVTGAIAQAGDHDRSTAALVAHLVSCAKLLLVAIAPAIGASILASIVATVGQAEGIVVSMKPVTPDLQRVSPGAGLKRIFSVKSLLDLLRMLLKAAVVGTVAWQTFRWTSPLVVGSMYQPVAPLSRILWESTLRFVAEIAAASLLIGGVDYMLQRYLLTRTLRMSKDEIKRERKNQDGDPIIKGERKRLGRQLASAAPRERVSAASLMVVNPTHYAVAVRYVPAEHPLPRVVAKGLDEHALELRRLATEEGVPIVGNPPVARRLHGVEVDAPIPPEMFETVAALLRWVEAVGARTQARSLPC